AVARPQDVIEPVVAGAWGRAVEVESAGGGNKVTAVASPGTGKLNDGLGPLRSPVGFPQIPAGRVRRPIGTVVAEEEAPAADRKGREVEVCGAASRIDLERALGCGVGAPQFMVFRKDQCPRAGVENERRRRVEAGSDAHLKGAVGRAIARPETTIERRE